MKLGWSALFVEETLVFFWILYFYRVSPLWALGLLLLREGDQFVQEPFNDDELLLLRLFSPLPFPLLLIVTFPLGDHILGVARFLGLHDLLLETLEHLQVTSLFLGRLKVADEDGEERPERRNIHQGTEVLLDVPENINPGQSVHLEESSHHLTSSISCYNVEKLFGKPQLGEGVPTLRVSSVPEPVDDKLAAVVALAELVDLA